jgi:2'-5' RNA ligase
LFVAVTPPDDVLDQVEQLVGQLQEHAGIDGDVPEERRGRWTVRSSWHVTLRFLGEVDDPAPVADVLGTVGRAFASPVESRMGRSVELLGQSVLCLPVAGVDGLAAAVTAATAELGQPPEVRAFHGHLTLARLARGERPDLGRLRRLPDAATWPVCQIELVQSHRDSDGSRYEMLASFPLG